MDAIILMAGAGSRLGASTPKPLVQIGGRALISYTFDALERVGVTDVHVVVGAHNGLASEVRALLPRDMRFHVIVNPEPQKQNGISVLCAAGKVSAPFFLMMGDHLFEPTIFETLLARINARALDIVRVDIAQRPRTHFASQIAPLHACQEIH
ncbi:MAG: NTP transferase domain-containing protein, partial [Chthoniobacterales bacterium]